jgi:hypothetical protein
MDRINRRRTSDDWQDHSSHVVFATIGPSILSTLFIPVKFRSDLRVLVSSCSISPPYRRIESLHGYVLIAQNYCHVEHYARQPENQWLLTDASDPAAILPLPSIDARLALAEVYDRVPPT